MFMSAMALTAMFAAACSNEMVNAPETSEGTVLTAGFAPEAAGSEQTQTRTVLENDKTVKWTAGDRIAVNGKVSKDAEISETGVTAKFSFDDMLEAPYSAVFPAAVYKDAGTVTLPAVQTWKEGSFAAAAAPMCAYVTGGGTKLSFNHLCSVVKLTINKPASDAEKFACIEFRGNDGEQICGDFAIDYESCTLTPSAAVSDADKKIRYDIDWNIAADAQVVAYIVVPAGEYSKGFTVKIQDKQGRIMEKSSSAKTLKQGTVHEMPELSFEQTGTETGVEIKTAADLLKFASDYNSGVYAGSESSLVATLMNDIAFTDEDNAAFASIGNTGGNKFKGCFNGNSKTISNFNSGKALFASVNDIGIVKDLTIEGTADVTLSASENDMNCGVLVEYNRGLIQRCTTNVAYTVDASAVTKTLCVGGIAGRMPTCDAKIVNCVNNGALTVTGSKVETYIGGIVGLANGGNAEIRYCTSNGVITSEIDKNNSSHEYCGGIAGRSGGKIVGCDNGTGGNIFVKNSCKNRHIGGIVGANGGSLTECVNYAEIAVVGDGRYVQLGGIIGSHSGVSELKNICNRGSVRLEKIKNERWANMRIGGCIGESTNESATFSPTMKNMGQVTVTSGQNWTNATKGGVCLGGVFGYLASSASVLENEGDVTFENSHNPGSATVYVGGIVGFTDKVITIGMSTNKGTVALSSTKALAYNVNGILGGASAEVTLEDNNDEGTVDIQVPSGE